MIVKIVLLYLLISIVCCKNASEWRSRSIYQILTDRFCPSNFSSLRCSEQIMSENASRNYCGGTYRGIINQLDYIVEMGFNALWISPIPSNINIETIYGVGWHGYWQDHIYQLNENFGSEKDLIDLINEAHKHDIWIINPNIFINHIVLLKIIIIKQK
jgi:alpha-amylase